MGILLQQLFEKLNDRIDKPIEYNHILTSELAKIDDVLSQAVIQWIDGMPYLYDPLRQRLVSVPRASFAFGWYGNNVTNRYLKLAEVTTMGTMGLPMPRKGIITALSGKSRNSSNWTLEVRKNGIPITMCQADIISGQGEENTIEVDFEKGDFLQFYASGSGIDYPIGMVEIAWTTD